MKGTRADIRMVELNLASSRERARALIMSGAVYLDTLRIDKPGENVPIDSVLTLKENPVPFVSRGGLKLEKALKEHGLDINGAVALDIGASTGGFTDCMLQNGASKVYAIDVGYGQLDWKLRNDERVVVLERTNARFMEPAWFMEVPDFATIDVAFISIRLILPALYSVLKEGGRVVALVKPQFEAGREKVGKNGVVRDIKVHEDVLLAAVNNALDCSFDVLDMDFSPITGPKGNIEFLLILQKSAEEKCSDLITMHFEQQVKKTVISAHEAHKTT